MFERGKKDGLEGERSTADRESDATNRAAVPAQTSGGGGRSTAVIGRSIQIDGDLRGDEDLRIEGQVTGTIHLKNNSLTIGSQGRIKADIYGKSVFVEGTLEGDLYGSERVAIRKNAQVLGNVTAPLVSIEDGARFKGSVEMDQKTVEAAFGTTRAQKPGASPASGGAKGSEAKPGIPPAASPGPTGQRDTTG
jgi:cytoskeletal protein CcmA (bactofilin family)